MSDDDPELNSLERYTKRSPKLVLEEHSHCEVPAGCGGVVLRWIHGERELPIHLQLYTRSKERVLTVDGVRPTTSRPLLARGDHVLALRVPSVPGEGALMFVGRYVEDHARRVSRPLGVRFSFASAADGTWRATTAKPADERWRDDPFDDSAWHALVEVPMAPVDERSGDGWYVKTLRSEGAVAVGLPNWRGPLWVRRRFRIPLVGEEGG